MKFYLCYPGAKTGLMRCGVQLICIKPAMCSQNNYSVLLMDMHLAEILCCNIFEGKQQYELRNNSWQAESCANLHMGWAFIFEFLKCLVKIQIIQNQFKISEGGKWNSHQMPCVYNSRMVKKRSRSSFVHHFVR
jgi:hypothetical protein